MESSESSLTARDSVLAQGFAFNRTDTFEYRAEGPSTPSGTTCVGGPEGRICYPVYRRGEQHTVMGSADRYEHPDGRILYIKNDDTIVGPVLPGTYLSSARQRRQAFVGTAMVPLTLRIHDLKLSAKGAFIVSADFALDAHINGGSWQPEGEKATWSNHSGTANAFGGAKFPRLEFGANGKVSRFDYAVDRDAYAVYAGFGVLTFENFTRSSATCPTPFRCIRQHRFPSETVGFDKGSYATEDLCKASCKKPFDPYGNPNNNDLYVCQPSLKECL